MYGTISLQEFKDNQNYRDNFSLNDIFFKGIISKEPLSDILFFDNSNYFRDSKTANEHGNLYNMLINEMLSWKQLPLRKKSIIFTNSQNTARAFAIPRPAINYNHAKLYCVLPRVGAKIIISPKSDLWFSFEKFFADIGIRKLSYNLTDFNVSVSELAKVYNIVDYDQSIESFENLLIRIQKDKDFVGKLGIESTLIKDRILAYGGDSLKNLDTLFSPKNNNFQCYRLGVDKIPELTNREIWTDDQCILIDYSIFEKILEELK